jgi:biotin transporter BioY
MYVIAIAWLYVTLLMAATETSVTAGVLTFIFYGMAPLALLVWLLGTPQRRRNKAKLPDPE